MVHARFTEAFTPGTRFALERDEAIEIETRVIGELTVPSGRIHVSDPLTTSFEDPGTPLARQAPTGSFPVEVAIAHFENDDRRVACSRVRFDASAPATRWELALFEGQPPPGADDMAGYGVDTGTGCFFDAAARADVDEATSNDWLDAMEANAVPTWTWHVAEVGKANVVMCSSGWGDGFYGSWWGFDAAGRVVELVTDFEVLIGPSRETVELPLPLSAGRVRQPLLDAHGLTVKVPLLSRRAVIVTGPRRELIELSDGSPVETTERRNARRYTWKQPAPGVRLAVSVIVAMKPLDVVTG
jgi:hypothetical protein